MIEFNKRNTVKTTYRDGSLIKGSGGSVSANTVKNVSLLVGGAYLPAEIQPDGSYKVDISNVQFTGNIRALGDIQAFVKGEDLPIDLKSLASLSDVGLSNLQDGQILVYDAVKKLWVNKDNEGGGGIPAKHTHKCEDITDIADLYTDRSSFVLHRDSKIYHTNDTERTKWNDAATAIDQHTGDQDLHCTYDDKSAWNTAVADLELHTLDTNIHHTHNNKGVLDKFTPAVWSKLSQLLDKIIIMPSGEIKFNTDISATGEITAHKS